jgi:hypothetical protein
MGWVGGGDGGGGEDMVATIGKRNTEKSVRCCLFVKTSLSRLLGLPRACPWISCKGGGLGEPGRRREGRAKGNDNGNKIYQ